MRSEKKFTRCCLKWQQLRGKPDRDFAPSARERFDVRRTAAAMEQIFLRVAQSGQSED